MKKTERSTRLGSNIRNRRKSRNLSADQLAAAVAQVSGVDISGDALLTYEHGSRPLSVERLFDIAEALDCSTQDLVNGLDRRHGPAPETAREIPQLSTEDHNTLTRIASQWRGDKHALILTMAVFTALPDAYALDALIGLLSNMSLALHAGDLRQEDLPDGLPYLEEYAGALAVKTSGKK